MKRISIIILLKICVLGILFGETLVVSGHYEYPPFMYKSGDEIIGVGLDITKAALKKEGINVVSKYVGNWKRCLQQAEFGEIDIIIGAYKTKEREKYLVFTDEIIVLDPTSIFVKKGNEFPFEYWEDLTGKRIGRTFGDKVGGGFDEFAEKNLKIQYASSRVQNMEKLLLERLDIMASGYYANSIIIKKNGFEGKIVARKKPIRQGEMYMAISKKSKYIKYLSNLNKEIKKMKKNGKIKELLEKHMENAAKM